MNLPTGGRTRAELTMEWFYRDMRRYALPTQLFFLFQRVGQLEALKQPGLFDKLTIAADQIECDRERRAIANDRRSPRAAAQQAGRDQQARRGQGGPPSRRPAGSR